MTATTIVLNPGDTLTVSAPIPIVVPPITIPSGAVYWLGKLLWAGDWSWGGQANSPTFATYGDQSVPNAPGQSGGVVTLTCGGQWSGWLPYFANPLPAGQFNTSLYTHLNFWVRPTVQNQKLSITVESMNDTPDGVPAMDLGPYGTALPGVWTYFSIPIADLKLSIANILKFGIQDQTGLAKNVLHFDGVAFQ